MTPEIDWNKWHKIITTSINAFDVDTMMQVVNKFNVQWHEDDPVSAISIYSTLHDVCEDLIARHEAGDNDERGKYNTYKELGCLTTSITLFGDDLFQPDLVIRLHPDEKSEYYFSIEFITASQIF